MASTSNSQLVAARLRTLHFLSWCSRLSLPGEVTVWTGESIEFDALEALDSMESKIAVRGLSTSWGKVNAVLRGGDVIYIAVDI